MCTPDAEATLRSICWNRAAIWGTWSCGGSHTGRPVPARQAAGTGRDGEVWEARDEVLGRAVAVKVISVLGGGGSTADEARARFLREARITAALQHPHIVTVPDLGTAATPEGDAPFLVMQLLRGEGLEAAVRRGPLSGADAARWGVQICEALAEAHAVGVLHRDIKPANIFVASSARVKVLDFGIARAADPSAADGRLTRTGLVVGTAAYMTPEQARGYPEERSDLYAVGCVLFELCTGRLPFSAPDTLGLLTAHLNDVPPVPSRVAPGISPVWDRLILRLLAKDPRDRCPLPAASFCPHPTARSVSAGGPHPPLRGRPHAVAWRVQVEHPQECSRRLGPDVRLPGPPGDAARRPSHRVMPDAGRAPGPGWSLASVMTARFGARRSRHPR
ncbi:serine/threonine-protein kinase [Streptomyces sp. NPDC090231]|uniref:serine/threonine-protein kinase n=1 Tax=unclassified Streptomyces TaxID=2593676 RepID=UPI00382529AD